MTKANLLFPTPVWTVQLENYEIVNEEMYDYIKYEQNKDIYTQQDVDRFSSLAYLFSLGLGVKNLSVIKSLSDRGVGFFETYFQISDNDPEEIKIAIGKFSEIVGSYILEDL